MYAQITQDLAAVMTVMSAKIWTCTPKKQKKKLTIKVMLKKMVNKVRVNKKNYTVKIASIACSDWEMNKKNLPRRSKRK